MFLSLLDILLKHTSFPENVCKKGLKRFSRGSRQSNSHIVRKATNFNKKGCIYIQKMLYVWPLRCDNSTCRNWLVPILKLNINKYVSCYEIGLRFSIWTGILDKIFEIAFMTRFLVDSRKVFWDGKFNNLT